MTSRSGKTSTNTSDTMSSKGLDGVELRPYQPPKQVQTPKIKHAVTKPLAAGGARQWALHVSMTKVLWDHKRYQAINNVTARMCLGPIAVATELALKTILLCKEMQKGMYVLLLPQRPLCIFFLPPCHLIRGVGERFLRQFSFARKLGVQDGAGFE